MALSSNYYQQIWWTGKGRVRFSDSLALGRASGLRNLTRKGIDTEILKLAWEKNREGKEMEKSWTNCEIAISEQFQIPNLLKMLHVCGSVRILNLAQRWNQKSTTHWVPMTGGGRFPESRGHRSAARNPDGQDFTYNLFRTPATLLLRQTSQSWLPAMKRSATNRGPGRG